MSYSRRFCLPRTIGCMPFTSVELARRVEAAEVSLLDRACRSLKAREARVASLRIGSGLAAYAGEDSPLNKVIGLGFGPDADASSVPTEVELDAVERMFFERSAPVQVEACSLCDPALLSLLSNRGYRPVGFENVSARLLTKDEPYSGDGAIAIRHGSSVDSAAWLDVLVDGFAAPDTQGIASHQELGKDALRKAIGGFALTPGMHQYLASGTIDGQEVATGGAAMMLTDGVAQLCGAATLPEHRGRGVQSSLLARRIFDAANAGCDVMVVTTQPGSTSLKNMQKQGFEVMYVRLLMTKTL